MKEVIMYNSENNSSTFSTAGSNNSTTIIMSHQNKNRKSKTYFIPTNILTNSNTSIVSSNNSNSNSNDNNISNKSNNNNVISVISDLKETSNNSNLISETTDINIFKNHINHNNIQNSNTTTKPFTFSETTSAANIESNSNNASPSTIKKENSSHSINNNKSNNRYTAKFVMKATKFKNSASNHMSHESPRPTSSKSPIFIQPFAVNTEKITYNEMQGQSNKATNYGENTVTGIPFESKDVSVEEVDGRNENNKIDVTTQRTMDSESHRRASQKEKITTTITTTKTTVQKSSKGEGETEELSIRPRRYTNESESSKGEKVIIQNDLLKRLQEEKIDSERNLHLERTNSTSKTRFSNQETLDTTAELLTLTSPPPPPPPVQTPPSVSTNNINHPVSPMSSHGKEIVYEWDEHGNQIVKQKLSKVISSPPQKQVLSKSVSLNLSSTTSPVPPKKKLSKAISTGSSCSETSLRRQKKVSYEFPFKIELLQDDTIAKSKPSQNTTVITTVTVTKNTTILPTQDVPSTERPSSLLLLTNHTAKLENNIKETDNAADTNESLNTNNKSSGSSNNNNNNINGNTSENITIKINPDSTTNVQSENINSVDNLIPRAGNDLHLNSKGNRPPPVVPKPKMGERSPNVNNLRVNQETESLYAKVLKKKDRGAESPLPSPTIDQEDSLVPPTPVVSPVEMSNEPVYALPPFAAEEQNPTLTSQTSQEIPIITEPIYDAVTEDTKQMILQHTSDLENQPIYSNTAATQQQNGNEIPIYVNSKAYDFIDQSITLEAEEPSPLDSPGVFSLTSDDDNHSIRSDSTTVFPYGPKPEQHKKGGLHLTSAITSLLHRTRSKNKYNVTHGEDKQQTKTPKSPQIYHPINKGAPNNTHNKTPEQQRSPQHYHPPSQDALHSSEQHHLEIKDTYIQQQQQKSPQLSHHLDQEDAMVSNDDHQHYQTKHQATTTTEQLYETPLQPSVGEGSVELKPRIVTLKIEDANPNGNSYNSFPSKGTSGMSEPRYRSASDLHKNNKFGFFARKFSKKRPKSDLIDYDPNKSTDKYEYAIYSDVQIDFDKNNNNNNNSSSSSTRNNNTNKKSTKNRFRRIRSFAPSLITKKDDKIKRNNTTEGGLEYYSKERQQYFQRKIEIYDC